MVKRSRDGSFSPSGDESTSVLSTLSPEPEDSPSTKIVAYDTLAMTDRNSVMQCSLPPHPTSLSFKTVEDFEIHYAKEHTNRCAQCGKNLPTLRFLELHIDENHNPVREALAAKGEKTYACFLPDCDKLCSNPTKRKMHLIDKHNFPKLYNFRIVNTGIDNTNSLLKEGRRRRVSVTNDQPVYHQRTPSISKLASQAPSESNLPQSQTQQNIAAPKLEQTCEEGIHPNRVEHPISVQSDPIDELDRSFAALQFIPRSVQQRRPKP